MTVVVGPVYQLDARDEWLERRRRRLILQQDRLEDQLGRVYAEIERREAKRAYDERDAAWKASGLSVRITNTLRRHSITTLEEALEMSDRELLRLHNFGMEALIALRVAGKRVA